MEYNLWTLAASRASTGKEIKGKKGTSDKGKGKGDKPHGKSKNDKGKDSKGKRSDYFDGACEHGGKWGRKRKDCRSKPKVASVEGKPEETKTVAQVSHYDEEESEEDGSFWVMAIEQIMEGSACGIRDGDEQDGT